MKITFEEVVANNESWLHSEILNSVPIEVMDKATKEMCYDVKLIINEIEVEPLLFNNIMSKINYFIQAEAKELVKQKLEDAEYQAQRLLDLVNAAKAAIIDEYSLDVE